MMIAGVNVARQWIADNPFLPGQIHAPMQPAVIYKPKIRSLILFYF